MLCFLAPMTQLNSKLERLLSQRSFSTLRKLRNLCDRRPRLRVCPQLFDIRFGVFAAHRLLRLGRLLFCFFRQLLSPEFVSELTTTNALRRNLHQSCMSPLSLQCRRKSGRGYLTVITFWQKRTLRVMEPANLYPKVNNAKVPMYV
jgi:hypothetical protein